VNSDGKIDSCELLKVYEAIAKMKGYDLKHASEQVDKLLKQFGAESAGSSLNKAEFIAALQGGEIFCLFHK
jgi:Ca2+-binding EF-hand superfamily protein